MFKALKKLSRVKNIKDLGENFVTTYLAVVQSIVKGV